MAEDPTFKIPKDIIEPIIQAHVAAAVTEALSDRGAVIQKAVGMILNQKVDSEGRPSNSSYADTTWIQWAMRAAVKKAVQAALEEQVAFHKEALKKAIAEELRLGKKHSPLAKSLISGMVGALTDPSLLKYRIRVEYDNSR